MSVLNTPLECAVRLLILLDTWYPEQVSKQSLVYLDYAVVHTANFGGPESLHPDLPDQVSELAVKYSLVSDGLKILVSQRLCRVIPTPGGLLYQAGDSSSGFLRLFRSAYCSSLTDRAEWLLASYAGDDSNDLSRVLAPSSLIREVDEMLESVVNVS